MKRGGAKASRTNPPRTGGLVRPSEGQRKAAVSKKRAAKVGPVSRGPARRKRNEAGSGGSREFRGGGRRFTQAHDHKNGAKKGAVMA